MLTSSVVWVGFRWLTETRYSTKNDVITKMLKYTDRTAKSNCSGIFLPEDTVEILPRCFSHEGKWEISLGKPKQHIHAASTWNHRWEPGALPYELTTNLPVRGSLLLSSVVSNWQFEIRTGCCQKEWWLTPQWGATAWARRQLQGREAPWNSGVAEVAEREKIYVPLLTSACLKHAYLQQFITISLLYEWPAPIFVNQNQSNKNLKARCIRAYLLKLTKLSQITWKPILISNSLEECIL